jgi:hypothetical protein
MVHHRRLLCNGIYSNSENGQELEHQADFSLWCDAICFSLGLMSCGAAVQPGELPKGVQEPKEAQAVVINSN